ncbi:Uma2 family endonuclease [Scytonema sp. NUACC26]|uniref:Uma2 family endonuclease n=1 Tax=Scytonema sp. NUACC26 TaxID=3140176 RepID=UPI0034DBA045
MTVTVSQDLSEDFTERGWRTEIVTQPDGSEDYFRIPLTSEEFLHPQEGYRLPNSTFHEDIAGSVKDILTRRYANDRTTGVFRDLIVKWGTPDLKNHCPDTFVVFGLQNKEQVRTEFVVPDEGVRPGLIVEVVSPRYGKEDRETKVKQYARAGVREYLIFDRRKQRKQTIEEVLGYRLVDGQYLPLTPDEDGLILFETVGLSIGLQDGRVVMVDAQTGERLLTSQELEQLASQAEQRVSQAEQRASQSEQRASQAEQRAAKLAELLR